jgi:hypothetical protein
MVDHLDNTDVHWDGTLVGITPTIVGEAARQLLALGDVVIPELVAALHDESRFVVAHVLLTVVSGVQYHTEPWNGLRVDLSMDDEVVFDIGQRSELARRWGAWHQATPHPRSLPK